MKNLNRVRLDPTIASESLQARPALPTFHQEIAGIDLDAFAWTYAQKSGELASPSPPDIPEPEGAKIIPRSRTFPTSDHPSG